MTAALRIRGTGRQATRCRPYSRERSPSLCSPSCAPTVNETCFARRQAAKLVAATKSQAGGEIVRAAFGAKNRSRLIDVYFASQRDTVASLAWSHVYRLLLWADQTTGLAHCYESDKCQPGKNWYARSLAFHDWLSTAL